MSAISFYLENKDWDCNFKYDEKGQEEGCEPFYTFNWGERFGNVLLIPLSVVVEEWEETDSCLYGIVLLIVGLVAGVFAIIGYIVKRVSECFNPNGSLRREALAKWHFIIDWDAWDMVTPTDTKCLAYLAGNVSTLFQDNIVNKKLQSEREPLRVQFQAAWDKVSEKATIRNADFTAEKEALRGLVFEDQGVLKALNNYFKEFSDQKIRADACSDFNTLLNGMS